MPDHDALDERLRAVERRLTDEDCELPDVGDAAELTRAVETLSARLDEAEDRLDELDAATQSLRGYVGNVRAVNDAVERRADAALAKAEAIETDSEPANSDASGRRSDSARTASDERTPPNRATAFEEDATRRRVPPAGASGPLTARDESTPSDDSEPGLLARVLGRLPGAP